MEATNNSYLEYMPQIEIEACESNNITIFDVAEEVFPGGINLFDSIIKDDFRVTNKASAKTMALFPTLIKNAKSAVIFNPVEKFAGSQTQLIKLCRKYKEYPDLFKNGVLSLLELDGLLDKRFFVALVHVSSDGLSVNVRRLELDRGLYGEFGRRIVVLATEN